MFDYIRIVVYSDKFNVKTRDLFHWDSGKDHEGHEKTLSVCVIQYLYHTQCALQLCAEKGNDFMAVLYLPSYFVHL